MAANTRPCGSCRHLDGRALPSGAQFCWQRYGWQRAADVVASCPYAERANGQPPPSRIWFTGERQ